MEKFKPINVEDAQKLIQTQAPTIVDVRDPLSYQTEHIDGAVQIDDQNIQEFLAHAPKDKPILCYCFHGFSSQNAAQFLIENGFSEVYSMDGGFEEWKNFAAK